MNVIYAKPEMTSLPLGRVGENERTQIVFDVAETLEEFPDAEIVLLVTKPRSYDTYEAEITTPDEEGTVSWTVTADDLTTQGTGCCQLMATKGTAVAKSMDWQTKIEKGLIPPAEVST